MRLKKIVSGVIAASMLTTGMPSGFQTVSAKELPDPVLHVTFDEADATDVTGRGNDGTVVGNPEFIRGVSGKAIHLVNSDSVAGVSEQAEQYIDFGKPEDLQFGTEDFSLAFWFKTEPHSKEGAVISNKNWDSGGNQGFNIGDMNQGINLNFNTSSSLSRIETDRFAEVSDGMWHHIAATFDRDGDMVFYIDGETPKAGNFSNNAAVQDISGRAGASIDAENFVLGADGRFKNSVSNVYLDELNVYKSVLTKEDVNQLYSSQQPEQTIETPVLDVNFDAENADDVSDFQNHGSIIGTPEFVDGVQGKAIHLENSEKVSAMGVTAEQYVNFGKPKELQFGTEDFTIMFWYKSDGNDSEEVAVVSNKDWNSGGNPGFAIGDMRNGMTLNFRANEAEGRLDTGRYGGATEKDRWHHIAAVFNRTGNMTLYVDGKNADSTSISAQAGKTIDVADFVLGADGLGHYGVKDSYIDELKVYRAALTQEEIQNYNAPFVLKNTIEEYEKLAEESTASKEKIDAFKKALADIKAKAEGVTDLDEIAKLNELLKKAYNEFTGPDKGNIHFEVISDTHIPGTDNNNATNQKFIDVLEDLKRDYPDTSVIMNAGDFSADGNETQVKGYFNILEEYKDDFTFMTALGNHDVRWKSGWDEIYERYMRYNSEYMGDTDGAVYFDKWIDGYHFIVLNTEWDIKDRAYISPEQLEWLDKTMAENADPSKPIFIAFHQAMRDTYYNSNDWSIGVQDYALKEVLRKYPQTIMFTGHIHNGLGTLDVVRTDYGTMVDVPSLKDNDYGDRRGQLGYHVTVYDGKVRLDLRDYLNDEWIPEYSYEIEMNAKAYPEGKVLDVNFDDGSAKDLSGHGNDGAIVGDIEFAEGEDGGQAVHIVNSDAVATKPEKAEQYIDFGDVSFGKEDFTLMFDYKGETSDGDGCVIGNKDWNTGGNPGFAVGAFGGNPGMGLNFNTEGSSRVDIGRYTKATDGEWHKIVATFDRDGEMTLYIDGQAAESKDISEQAGKSIDVEGLQLVLGADGNYQNAVRDMYVDNLKVYKHALGAAEIESTFHPYQVETGKDSITISWPSMEDEEVEPAYLVLNGEKKVEIASGETSKTITGLEWGTEYTVLLVNREKAHANNYRDVYPFVVTTIKPNAQTEELEALVAENSDRYEVNYSADGWSEFEKALNEAKEILNDFEAEQAVVDEAKENLEKAIEGLRVIGITLSGKVTDEAGAALADITISVENGADKVISTKTDANGNYVLPGVLFGERAVTADSNIFAVNEQKITASEEKLEETLNFTMKTETTKVEGKVTAVGEPVEGATVTIGDKTATTDAEGNYAIDEVVTKVYTVKVEKEGYDVLSKEVAVAKGDKVVANFMLSPLTKEEADYENNYDDGVKTWDNLAGNTASTTISVVDGQTKIIFPGGHTNVYETKAPQFKNGVVEMDITSDKPGIRIGILLRAQNMNNRVYLGVGDDANRYFAEYWGKSGNAWTSMYTGPEFAAGQRMHLKAEIIDKTVKLWVNDQLMFTETMDGMPMDAGYVGINTRNSHTIYVDNVKVTSYDLPEGEAEDVAGRVVDGQNQAIEGAVVELLDNNGEVLKATTTDALGNYKFKNIVVGEYSVRATAGELSKEVPVTVVKGEDYVVVDKIVLGEVVDKSDLAALIKYAKSQQENEDYQYVVPIVKEKFEAALAEAERVNADDAATQEAVDAAYDELLDMVQHLAFTGNTSNLKVLVDTAKGLHKEVYTPESWKPFADALKVAEAVLADENALQEEIDAARDALQKAMDGLKKVSVDKSKLEKLVKDAEKKYESKLDEYTSVTAEVFRGALDVARAVLVGEDVTQKQVDEAYANLRQAIFGLRLIPNKDKLEDLINKIEDMDLSRYTAKTAKAVRTALGDAKAVFEDENATQAEVDEAVKRLQASVDGLKATSAKADDTDDQKQETTNSKKSAKTGDVTAPIGWAVAGVLAVLAMAAVFFARKKRR